jgi:RimJ/RimL family protein N-acetyltransferase
MVEWRFCRMSTIMITIRPYQEDDIDDLYEAALESHQHCYEFLPWCHPDYSREEAEAFVLSRAQAWDDQTDFSFAIIDEASGLYLGGVGVNFINWTHRFANIGYWVRRTALGQGIGVMALQQAAEYIFENTDLARLEIVISTENENSISVAEEAGALDEGILHDRLYLHGEFHDAHMFAFLKDE